MTDAIQETIQKYAPGDVVELYQLDATVYGSSIYYFYQGEGASILFDGDTYVPFVIKTSGLERSAGGIDPEPTISFSDVQGSIGSLAISASDLLGVTLTRIRTFKQFLDGEAEADPNSVISTDIFLFNKKIAHNKVYIEWSLVSCLGYEGRLMPRRQVLRDTCPWIYRTYSGSAFVYTKATCPYTGSSYFTASGQVTLLPQSDVCGKRMSDCILRYGTSALPYGGFPGAGKNR